MEVVLLILKIIGIVLLSIIGLLLLFSLLMLFWPFSYRIKAHKDDENFNAAFRILWLLGLLTVTVIYDGEARLKVKVLGIPVYKLQIWPTEEKENATAVKETGTDGDSIADNETETSENEKEKQADLTDASVIEGEFFDEGYEDSEMLSEEDMDRAIEEGMADTEEEDAFDKLPLFKKIKAFILKIKEFILKLRDKCYNIKDSIKQQIEKIKKICKDMKYYYKLVQHPSVKPALLKVWDVVKKMLKHVKPGRVKAEIEYGSGDPASTMKVYGYYCMIYPFYGKHIRFMPDMEEKVLRFDASISGRVQVFRMMWLGWTLFADRNFRKLIRLIRREVMKRGRK